MPKIFITGATGFIGRVVTELAVKQGYTVNGLSRRPEGDEILKSLGAVPVRGDLTTHDVLSRESGSADIVLHLAFDHDFTKPYDQILKLDTEAVDALAKPLVGTNKPFVISSGTLLVRPDPNGGETDETAPMAEIPRLQRHLCELNARSWVDKGVRVIVIRLPQYVYGRGNETGFAAQLIKLAGKAGESAYVDNGAVCTSNVYVDDAARLYLLVAEKAAAGEIYNSTGHWNTTYKAIATAIGNLLKVPVRSIPKEEAEKHYGPMAPFFQLDNRARNKKAVETLGWRPVGPDLLTEIESGSYKGVAEKFKSEL